MSKLSGFGAALGQGLGGHQVCHVLLEGESTIEFAAQQASREREGEEGVGLLGFGTVLRQDLGGHQVCYHLLESWPHKGACRPTTRHLTGIKRRCPADDNKQSST